MYLSGYLTLPMYDYETGGHLHQYPIHIWWDSTHCATIQDMSGAYRTNFIIKYDTNGRVQWCNQIYTKGNSVETPYARAEWRRNCINDDYIYIIGDAAYTPNSYANIYFDTENDSLRRFVPCDSGIGFFVRYDKRTGRYVSHGIVPAENVLTCLTPAPASPARWASAARCALCPVSPSASPRPTNSASDGCSSPNTT